MNSFPENYEISISPEEFDKLRSDKRFLSLLQLARIVNSLNFTFNAYHDHIENDSPAGLRQKFNSVFFMSAILLEGIKTANKLKIQFEDREVFQNGFGKFLESEATRNLIENVLKPLRDKFVFHFDDDVAPKVLKTFEIERYVFATSFGTRAGDVYFNLADEMGLNYIIGNLGSQEDEKQKLGEIFTSLIDTIKIYVESANQLIGDVLHEMNWKMHKY